MARTLGLMAACLVIGAGAMTVGSRVSIRLEPVPAPMPVDATAPPAEPRPLAPMTVAAGSGFATAGGEPAVRPASFFAPVPQQPLVPQQGAMADAPPVQPPTILRVEATILGKTVVTSIGPGVGIVSVGNPAGEVKIRLSAPPNGADEVAVFLGTDPPVTLAKPDAAAVRTAVPFSLKSDTLTIAAQAFTDGKPIELGVVYYRQALPGQPQTRVALKPAGAAGQITVESFQTTRYLQALTPVNNGSPPQVFGGYLRLAGKVALPSPTFTFYIYNPTTFAFDRAGITRPAMTAVPNTWEVELELDERLLGPSADLVVRVDSGPDHYFANQLFTLAPRAAFKPQAPALPTVATVVAGTAGTLALSTTGVLTRSRAESHTLTVAAAPTGAGAVALFVGNAPEPYDVQPAGTAFKAVPTPATSRYDLAVAGITGREVGERRAITLDVRVPDDGPTVRGVSAPGFGTGPNGANRVRVLFAGAVLKRDKVEAPGSYTLKYQPAEDKKVTVTTAAAIATLPPPSYDEASNSVELTITGVLPGGYELGVRKDVVDVYDNPLRPRAGDVHVEALTAVSGGELPLQTPGSGVTLGTGPAVPFPEYTPRAPVSGFNPADKVETRVIRLYHNRDAHRVAQIVNRAVKSYNADTVALNRRVAERVRDDADTAQSERQRLERAAVVAAAKSREAERRVQAAQQQVDGARRDAAQATVLGNQQSLDLLQTNRDLTLAQTAAQAAAGNPAQPTTPEIAALLQQRAARQADIDRFSAGLASAGFDPTANTPTPGNIQSALDKTAAARDDAVRQRQTFLLASDPANVAIKDREIRNLDQRLNVLAQVQQQAGLVDDLKRRQAVDDFQFQRLQAQAADPLQRTAERTRAEIANLQQVAKTANAAEATSQAELTAAQAALQAARGEEVKANEAAVAYDRVELLKRTEQFRREVAAATTDPDTYAPGVPNSPDPVLQCSIAVVGEGLIQVRGPLKGVNTIRLMCNQLDAPAGQVRVAVHTVQVNGERAERMEKAVANIQRYLDHSRFLTAQSGLMLRKAVTAVAARKAEEAVALCPPGSSGQAARDHRYLYAFFGKDFVDELADLDSEFLRTGNKLLGLHSMDSTSLSTALFLVALAKNSVRDEILQEFQTLVTTQLPQDEQQYYLAGLSPTGKHCEACCDKPFYMLAQNAKFQSLLGHFNAQIGGADTLSPIQREFIKLAQIFKNRLIVELQYKQRVVERSLLEERIGGDYRAELQKAKDKEDDAKDKLAKVIQERQSAIQSVTSSIFQTLGSITSDLKVATDDVSTESQVLLASIEFNNDITSLGIDIKALETDKLGKENKDALVKIVDNDLQPLTQFNQNGVVIRADEPLRIYGQLTNIERTLAIPDAQLSRAIDKAKVVVESSRKLAGRSAVSMVNPDAAVKTYRIGDPTKFLEAGAKLQTAVNKFRFTTPSAVTAISDLDRVLKQVRETREYTASDANLLKQGMGGVLTAIAGRITDGQRGAGLPHYGTDSPFSTLSR